MISFNMYVDFSNECQHLTMEQCHECDELCSGMIEQVTGNLIDWHDIANISDCKIAFEWANKNLSGILNIEFDIYDSDEFLGTVSDIESLKSFVENIHS